VIGIGIGIYTRAGTSCLPGGAIKDTLAIGAELTG
jgi:hypothetical protein